MPDYKKFSQIQTTLQSLSKMVADYASDFAPEKEEKGEQEDAYEDKDYADGGQDFAPLSGFNATSKDKSAQGDSKKKKMALMAATLKKKASSMGY